MDINNSKLVGAGMNDDGTIWMRFDGEVDGFKAQLSVPRVAVTGVTDPSVLRDNPNYTLLGNEEDNIYEIIIFDGGKSAEEDSNH